MSLHTIKGEVLSLLYEDKNSQFTIASLAMQEIDGKKVRKHSMTLKGNYFADIGDIITGSVEKQHNPKYGSFYKVDLINVMQARLDTDESLHGYLVANIKGVGPSMADKLINTFGGSLIKMLDEASSDLMKVPGMGRKTFDIMIDSWLSYKELKVSWPFVYGLGFGKALTNRIIEELGMSNVKEKIQKNPYELSTVNGVTFQRADAIALNYFNRDRLDPFRMIYGVRYLLSNSNEGDTYTIRSVLVDQLRILLNLDSIGESLMDKILTYLESRELIITDQDRIFPNDLYTKERLIAKNLILMKYQKGKTIDRERADSFVTLYEKRNGITFTKAQRKAIYRSAKESVTVITGGPGSGKTTTTGAIYEMFNAFDFDVAMAAPTGRAARRLSEATGGQADTIHRLLGLFVVNGPKKHGKENKLNVDVIIIDEVSMVDVKLMSALLEAVKPTTKLILIGDKNQLPSIGPGNVLHDILDSGKISVVELVTIFRQSEESNIVKNAAMINAGILDLENSEEGGDFFWVKNTNLEVLTQLFKTKITAKYGIQLDDIKVLTPFRRNVVSINTGRINNILQNEVNPKRMIKLNGNVVSNSVEYDEVEFRIGDPVMQLKNVRAKNINNGDIGKIMWVGETTDNKQVTVSIVVNYGGDIGPISYVDKEIRQLSLARAFTVHKSQGGEFRAVIIILPDEHQKTAAILKRNLLYTAVTRAEELCIIMASEDSLHKAITDDSYRRRLTMLAPWLEEFDYKLKRRKKRY